VYQILIITIDGEKKIVSKGNDPNKLAKEFCEKYVIPTALSQGVDTKVKVKKLVEKKDWIGILDVYMSCPADMFDSPDLLRIFNTKTKKVFYNCDYSIEGKDV